VEGGNDVEVDCAGGREEIFAVRRGPSPHRLAASAEGTNPAAEEEGGDRGRRVLVFWPLTPMAELNQIQHQVLRCIKFTALRNDIQ